MVVDKEGKKNDRRHVAESNGQGAVRVDRQHPYLETREKLDEGLFGRR